MVIDEEYRLHRRFDRMGRLAGDDGMRRLFRSHVLVVGLGGVGSWAAESLARSGVGRLTLVDFDKVCVTNANRQVPALKGTVGRYKAEVLAERLADVNPAARVDPLVRFYEESTSEELLAGDPDYVVDAIDNLTAKAHLLATCRARGIPVVTSTGASGRWDPTCVTVSDLARTRTDPMARELRKILRSKHGFPAKARFGIPAVWSTEEPQDPVELHYDRGLGFKCVCPGGANDQHSCERRAQIWGTASFVTGTYGFVLASRVVQGVLNRPMHDV